MTKALIKPQMLRWARERASLSVERLADKLKTTVERLQSWEQGGDSPTFRQAEKIAQQTHVPFGYLFLSTPPKEKLPIPDLRIQGGGVLTEQPSVEFLDLIHNVRFQQDWYRDYLLEQGAERLPFVGKFRLGEKIRKIALDISDVLQLESLRASQSNWEEYLRYLCDRCEEVGIWIMRAGYVGSNTHRGLDLYEFRGFAISDPIVPLVFINGKDAKAAQIFTLAHELAHIWLGESGVSNIRLDEEAPGPQAKIEQVCNAIAAEVLTPQAQFLNAWQADAGLAENVRVLMKSFKVSGVVIARRARDLGKISIEEYMTFFRQEQKSWDKQRENQKGGGNFYATNPVMNGRNFTQAVLYSAMSGKLLLRDAGGLLHLTPSTVQKLFYRQSEGG
ncbi:MAG: XRE family transcriptional regulator [Magnetococcus sp. DMHC-6]